MPDKDGRIKGIHVPSVPWHDDQLFQPPDEQLEQETEAFKQMWKLMDKDDRKKRSYKARRKT